MVYKAKKSSKVDQKEIKVENGESPAAGEPELEPDQPDKTKKSRRKPVNPGTPAKVPNRRRKLNEKTDQVEAKKKKSTKILAENLEKKPTGKSPKIEQPSPTQNGLRRSSRNRK